MNLMHRKVAPRTFDSDTTPDSGASASHASNGSNASQVLALGADFKFVRSMCLIRFGPGSESNESNESKVAPRTVDADTTPDARASDSDASD